VVQVVEAVEETMQINLQRAPTAGIIANIIFKLIEGGDATVGGGEGDNANKSSTCANGGHYCKHYI
jgi:hypothetical protein